jgi:hypothetical protein
MVGGVAHGIAWLIVGGAWDGPVSFRKPFGFGLSFGVTTITLAWFADRLGLGRRVGWLLLVPLAVANATEVMWVTVQRARDVASHFNVATTLDMALYVIVGAGAITVTTVVIVVLAALAFTRRSDDPALTLAIRVGLALVLVAVAGGVTMIMVGNARAEAGQTDALVQWGPAGDMKVTHFLGLHGMQVLSGLAVWLSATTMPAAARTRILAIAAVAYSGLVAAGTLQWLDGRALTQPGPLDGTLSVLSMATLTAVAVSALRTPRVAAGRSPSRVPFSGDASGFSNLDRDKHGGDATSAPVSGVGAGDP